MPEEPSKPRKSRDLKTGFVLENRYEIIERVSPRLLTRKTATTCRSDARFSCRASNCSGQDSGLSVWG
jgi:hypothetical protein